MSAAPSTSLEIDLRPSTSGISKHSKRPVRTDNSAQLKRAFDGLDQCLETIAAVKSAQTADDEFQIFANYVASELRGIADIQTARRLKRKLQAFFTNSLVELDEMVCFNVYKFSPFSSIYMKVCLFTGNSND